MGLEGVEDVMDEHERRLDRLVRATTIEMMKRVMLKTPVDTGRARANWNLAREAPDSTVDETLTAGDAAAKLQSLPQAVVQFKKGDVIFVTNGLPYIPALEDGHSKQAPNGMVKLTVKELETQFDHIVRVAKSGS